MSQNNQGGQPYGGQSHQSGQPYEGGQSSQGGQPYQDGPTQQGPGQPYQVGQPYQSIPSTPTDTLYSFGSAHVYPHASYMSGTVPGQILGALSVLRTTVEETDVILNKEFFKKKILGKYFLGDPKTPKGITKLSNEIQWLITRLTTEPMTEGIESERICGAFKPISQKLQIMAQTLRNGGDEMEGYSKFYKKDRDEMAEAIKLLRTSILAIVNLLLGNPLKLRRMSNVNQAEKLFQQGQQMVSMLRLAADAWSK